MKEPKTSGRAGKVNKEGSWLGAFMPSSSARRNLPIQRKELKCEVVRALRCFFFRHWGKNKKP